MAFKKTGFDFAALDAKIEAERAMTPAERAAEEAKEHAAYAAKRRAERAGKIKHTFEIQLTERPEGRYTMNNDTRFSLIANDAQGRTGRYEFLMEEALTDDALSAAIFDAEPGARFTVAGYWMKRGWNNQKGERCETWQFQVMTIETA